jgi:hypothetical protein
MYWLAVLICLSSVCLAEEQLPEPTVKPKPLFKKKAGVISGICGAVLDDGKILICFSTRQTLKRFDTVLNGVPVPLPWETCGEIYWSISDDGETWSFPKPIPNQDSTWVKRPAMSLTKDGSARVTWVCSGRRCVYADFRESWSPITEMTFDGERLDTRPTWLGGAGMPSAEHLGLACMSDGQFKLLMDDCTESKLYVAQSGEAAFSQFTRPKPIAPLSESWGSFGSFDARPSESPRFLANDHGTTVSNMQFDAKVGKWRVNRIPILSREDAVHKDVFGGWLTRATWAAPVQGCPTPTVVISSSGQGMFMTQDDKGKWSLPKLFAMEGMPYGFEPLLLWRKNKVIGLFDGEGGRISVLGPMTWPPDSLSVFDRPVAVGQPTDSGTQLQILLPTPNQAYPVLPDETLHEAFAAVFVRPASEGPHVKWTVDGKEAGDGAVTTLRIKDMGEHVIAASVGGQKAGPVTIVLKPITVEIVGGFSVHPGAVSTPRNDAIDDLQTKKETKQVAPGDDQEF